ncbi:MAG: lactate racemase domain-containing protein [Thermodesulfobacteriota bacterium]
MIGKGDLECKLDEDEVRSLIEEGIPRDLVDGKRVLVLTPDRTRTCPLPTMVRLVREALGERSSRLDFMVALGTHTPLSREGLLDLYGIGRGGKNLGSTALYNHEWNRPETFRRIGSLGPDEIEELSGGLLREEVPVVINRRIYDYDLLLVLGPVFPHEVVGFSGGAKYLFPGISGGEFLHFFHWLAAVITCMKIIGVKDTPVRRAIERAMEKVSVPVHCLSMVVNHEGGLCGIYAGGLKDAWSAAADLSSRVHVVTKPRAYHTVLGRAPAMYDEIWTAGKVMYKLEQVVDEGGTLIIYAPHVREVSRTWGGYIERAGYHVRDYFLAQMEKFKDIPRGVLAHLTHVRGTGTYENGVEKPRVNVVLATSIPRETCNRINLGYMDPDTIRLSDYMDREDEGILFVDQAGEILHRLADG